MTPVFIGFLFVFLNCEIPLGNGSLNLMPAVIGYVFLLVWAMRTGDGSARFLRIRLLSLLLGLLSVAHTLILALAVPLTGIAPLLLGGTSTVGALYVAYEVVAHVKETEKRIGRPLGGGDLHSAWFLLAMGNLLSLFVTYMESMALLCMALQLLSIAWFSAAIFRSGRKMAGK